jgi:hypothetical protein
MDGNIVLADAGAALPTGFNLGELNLRRLKAVADIMPDKVGSVRVRGLIAHALKATGNAAYLRIGSTARDFTRRFEIDCPEGTWMNKEDTAKASTFPTRLMKLTQANFDFLEQYGYVAAAGGTAAIHFI